MITYLTHFAETQQDAFTGLGIWSYVLLAILVAVEGPIATLLGAAAASGGVMNAWGVFFSASIGNLAADCLWYFLGYAGKIEWLLKLGSRIGLRRSIIERIEKGMHDHATKLLLAAKLTAGFVIPTLLAAGLAKVPWRRWFPVLSIGETIWTGSLVLIGYFGTSAIQQVERGIDIIIVVFSALFLLGVYLWMRRLLSSTEEFQYAMQERQKSKEDTGTDFSALSTPSKNGREKLPAKERGE